MFFTLPEIKLRNKAVKYPTKNPIIIEQKITIEKYLAPLKRVYKKESDDSKFTQVS